MKLKQGFVKFISIEFIQNVFFTSLNKIVLLAIGLFTSIIIAKSLGPTGRGYYSLAIMYIGLFTQFGNLGIHSTNIHYSALNKRYTSFLIGNSLFIGIIFGIILAIFFLFYTKYYPWTKVESLILLSSISIPISLIYFLVQNVLIGLNKINKFNTIELLNKFFITVSILIAVYFNHLSVSILLLIIILATIVSIFLVLSVLTKSFHISISLKFFSRHFFYGFKSYLASGIIFLQKSSVMYFLSVKYSVDDVGYFSIAQIIFDLILLVPLTFSSLIFPKLSSNRDVYFKWSLVNKSLFITSILMIIGIMLLYFLGENIIQLLYGVKFLNSSSYLILLSPNLILLCVISLISNYFACNGMPIIIIWAPFFSFICASLLYFSMYNHINSEKIIGLYTLSNFIIVILFLRQFIKDKPKKGMYG